MDWINDSLQALDRCTLNEGFNPLFLALRCEKDPMALYLIQMLLVREKIREFGETDDLPEHLKSKVSSFPRLSSMINFMDKKNRTALLLASKNGHLKCYEHILSLGGNPFVHCSKVNNVLHYAVMSEN